MILEAATIVAVVGLAPAVEAGPTVCGKPCVEPASPAVEYDPRVDAEVFNVYAPAPRICDCAVQLVAEGYTEDEVIDSGSSMSSAPTGDDSGGRRQRAHTNAD